MFCGLVSSSSVKALTGSWLIVKFIVELRLKLPLVAIAWLVSPLKLVA